MAKILHTADLHIKLKQDKRYRKDLITIIRFLLDSIKEYKPDFFVIAGDTFDTKSPTATESAIFTSFIRRILDTGVTTIIIPGNHDIPNHAEEASALKPFYNLHLENLHIINTPGIHTINGVDFMALPYLYHDREEILNKLYKEHNDYTGDNLYFIGHFWLDTYTTGNANYTPDSKEFMIKESFLSKFTKVKKFMLGHIHNGGWAFKDAYYAGAPFRTKFGEKADTGIYLHEDATSTRIPSPAMAITEYVISSEETLNAIAAIKELPSDQIVVLKINNLSSEYIGKINSIKADLEKNSNYVYTDMDLTTVKFNSATTPTASTTNEFFKDYIKMNNICADEAVLLNIINAIMSEEVTDKSDTLKIRHLGLK